MPFAPPGGANVTGGLPLAIAGQVQTLHFYVMNDRSRFS